MWTLAEYFILMYPFSETSSWRLTFVIIFVLWKYGKVNRTGIKIGLQYMVNVVSFGFLKSCYLSIFEFMKESIVIIGTYMYEIHILKMK